MIDGFELIQCQCFKLILIIFPLLDIPLSMWRLISNPVYLVTCLGACSELIIVSGFLVFLPKYLETQFSIGKSQASVFTGCKYQNRLFFKDFKTFFDALFPFIIVNF